MKQFTFKLIKSNYLLKELENIGFDDNYKEHFFNKRAEYNIKIYNLSIAQANILKQTALIFGADCAVHKNVITGKIKESNVILCANKSQLLKILDKLKLQPFKLAILSNQIINFLNSTREKTKIVGILNITPNSFSDGGDYYNSIDAQKHLIKLIEDGADMIDIGAESTKPYSEDISSIVQIQRLSSIIKFIQKENISIPISIDTRSSEVAKYVLDNGINIINDVSGLEYDNFMLEILSKYNASVILQHSTGKTENYYKFNNVVDEVFFKLKYKLELLKNYNIKNVILDVGIGFGKNELDSRELIDRIEEFYSLNAPIMVGHSRKSFLGARDSENQIKDALSLAYSYNLFQKKVDYIRVHNVSLHNLLLKNMPN